MAADYATDFYGWATDTAAKIRSGRLSEVDLEHVAEKIDSLGKSEQLQLSNRLVILIAHMLKWEFQASRASAPTQWARYWKGELHKS